MFKKYWKPARQDAFTLVELLVVVGIIAVLVSIILGSLASVREQANRVKCSSNLRQIALGVFLYAGNNHGQFPRTYYSSGAGYLANSNQGGIGHNPTNQSFSMSNPAGPVGTNSGAASIYLLLQSHQLPTEVFRCPSNPLGQTLDQSTVDEYANFPTPMPIFNSYSYASPFPTTGALAAGWRPYQTLSSEYPIASDLNSGIQNGPILLFNGTGSYRNASAVAYNDPPKVMAIANSNNHGNAGQNVVFVDGHVEWCPSPFCGPTVPGCSYRDNIFTSDSGIDRQTGKGGDVHAAPQDLTDIVMEPCEGTH